MKQKIVKEWPPPTMKESDIQKQIFNYCTSIAAEKNIVAFSIPNESLMAAMSMFGVDGKTKAMMVNHFKKMGMVSGIPDMCILYGIEKHDGTMSNFYVTKPHTLLIEVKKPDEKPTAIQKAVHAAIKRTGHEVVVVYSLDNFINELMYRGIV